MGAARWLEHNVAIGAMTAGKTVSLSFGDICSADFFYDAYLRADASTLRERFQTADKAPWLKKAFGVDELRSYVPVNPEVPALKPQEGEDFLLAHGSHFERAICLSDDCEIESRLGRAGAEPTGHILFAPVTEVIEAQRKTFTQVNWGRMLLIEDDGPVVEIRRVFPVAAEDVAARLSEEALEHDPVEQVALLRLQSWWQAYSSRRGPLVAAANSAKLASALQAHSVENADSVKSALSNVMALSWAMEGRSMERVGQAVDDAQAKKIELQELDIRPLINHVKAELTNLSEAAGNALKELSKV
jgi:hypothetical protein